VIRSLIRGLFMLGAPAALACGHPNNPDALGTLAGVVRDSETDAPIEGVTLVVAGIQELTGSDGRFEIDSVPEGAQQVAVTTAPTNSSIRLSDPRGEITLASNITRDLEPGEGYQANDGWIAFLRPDGASSRQVWRRSPAGAETQVSAFGTSSRDRVHGAGR
jgi:hypothetical protein